MINYILIICSMIGIFSEYVISAGAPTGKKEHRIVVLPFTASNVSASISNSISDLIREKLVDLSVESKRGATTNIVVLNRDQIQKVLGEEKLQQTCDAFQCVADAGAKLKADKIIIGLVSYKYGIHYIVVKAVDLGYKEETEETSGMATGGKIESANVFKVKASGEKLEREFDKFALETAKTLFAYYSKH